LQTQSTDLLQQRRLAIETAPATISWPLLVGTTPWLGIVFGVFGLTAPRNAAVYATIVLCALSFASAIFFILDFDRPLTGLIRLSSEPALEALRHLDTP
jgi:zinc transporter ZupT